MKRILANDLFTPVEAFDLFPAHKRNFFGAITALIRTRRAKPIPAKAALGI